MSNIKNTTPEKLRLPDVSVDNIITEYMRGKEYKTDSTFRSTKSIVKKRILNFEESYKEKNKLVYLICLELRRTYYKLKRTNSDWKDKKIKEQKDQLYEMKKHYENMLAIANDRNFSKENDILHKKILEYRIEKDSDVKYIGYLKKYIRTNIGNPDFKQQDRSHENGEPKKVKVNLEPVVEEEYENKICKDLNIPKSDYKYLEKKPTYLDGLKNIDVAIRQTKRLYKKQKEQELKDLKNETMTTEIWWGKEEELKKKKEELRLHTNFTFLKTWVPTEYELRTYFYQDIKNYIDDIKKQNE